VWKPDGRRRIRLRRRARRAGRLESRRHPGDRGGDVEGDLQLALPIGAVVDDIAVVVDFVTDTDAVAAVVMRARKGGAPVATVRATAATSLKATVVLRSSSSPWPPTFPSWLLVSLIKTSPRPTRPSSVFCASRRKLQSSLPTPQTRWQRLTRRRSCRSARRWRRCFRAGRVFAAHVLLVVADEAGVDLVGSGAVRTTCVKAKIVIAFVANAVGDKGTDVLRSSFEVRPPTCRWRLEMGRGATWSSLEWCASRSSLASFSSRRHGRRPCRLRYVGAFTLYDCRAWHEEIIGRTVVNGVRVYNPTFSPSTRSQRR